MAVITVEPSKLPAVLIVEDEPLIRMDAIDMIEDAGFKTYEAGSADEAIALMQRHEDIGVLFTDVDMPGTMDGLCLAKFVRDRWPPVVILIVSGAVGIDEVSMPEGSCFLPKPYSTVHVLKKLHRISVQLG